MRKLIIFAVLLALLAGGVFGVRPIYRKWMLEREMRHARDAFNQGDVKTGILWLRKALGRDSDHIDGVKLMGELAEQMRSPSAVYWRQRLVELQPTESANRLLLSRVAMANSQMEVARRALESVPEKDRALPEYLKLMGALSMSFGNFEEAESHYLKAQELQPGNPVSALNLAIVRLQRRDTSVAAAARQTLEALRTNGLVGHDALRHLTLDAMRRTNWSRAVILATELAGDTNAVLTDRLLELDVLKSAGSPQLGTALARFQRDAIASPGATFELGRWMLASVPHRGEVIQWLEQLPDSLRTNVPVAMVVADGYLAVTNWARLSATIEKQQWGEFEFMRSAFAARALREQGMAAGFRTQWGQALKATEGRLERLVPLQRLMAAWNWTSELEETLWVIVGKYPSEKGAVGALATILSATGNTRSLMALMAQESKSDPKSLEFRNNLAATALLLDAQEHRPHDLAKDVYTAQPENAAYASTYAFSLYLQKKHPEARQVLEKLKPADLEQPGVAGYYALVLAAAGEVDRAKRFASISLKTRLLPEEHRLFEAIR